MNVEKEVISVSEKSSGEESQLVISGAGRKDSSLPLVIGWRMVRCGGKRDNERQQQRRGGAHRQSLRAAFQTRGPATPKSRRRPDGTLITLRPAELLNERSFNTVVVSFFMLRVVTLTKPLMQLPASEKIADSSVHSLSARRLAAMIVRSSDNLNLNNCSL